MSAAPEDTVTLTRAQLDHRLARAWRRGYHAGACAAVDKLVKPGQTFRALQSAGWLQDLRHWCECMRNPDEPTDTPPPTLRVTLKDFDS